MGIARPVLSRAAAALCLTMHRTVVNSLCFRTFETRRRRHCVSVCVCCVRRPFLPLIVGSGFTAVWRRRRRRRRRRSRQLRIIASPGSGPGSGSGTADASGARGPATADEVVVGVGAAAGCY